jgi:hypothetical protein
MPIQSLFTNTASHTALKLVPAQHDTFEKKARNRARKYGLRPAAFTLLVAPIFFFLF